VPASGHSWDPHACQSLLATVLNVVLMLVPTSEKAPTAATPINAAISPYSIAVTPLSSLSNEIRSFNSISYC
jgi:hypothetical protein